MINYSVKINNMNTYLIFFGKSQDFTLHAFDSSNYIKDFDNIIKDFDELESKVLTVDDIFNRQILSKYNFIKNDKKYSLIKLYSPVQPFSGSDRGTNFGVAILSESDIKISTVNIAILDTAKKSFAQLSLNNLKFKSSDFLEDVRKIWEALIKHIDGNYLSKIEFNNNVNINVNKEVKAFLMQDILVQSTELNNETARTPRLYFSDDIEHLKRTQNRRGKELFPIYIKENNQYILYAEKPKPPTPPRETDEITNLKFENAELRSELNNFERKYRKFKDNASKKFKIASILAVVFCLSTLAFFFKSHFLDNKKDNPNSNDSTEQVTNYENGSENPKEQQQNQINLNDILADDTKRDILYTLLQNIENFDKTIKKDGVILSKEKKYNRIKEDLDELGLEISFAEKFKPNIDNSTISPIITNGQAKTVKDKTVKDKTVKDKTVKDETVKDKTVKDETVKDKTATDKTATDKTATDKTVEDKTANGNKAPTNP